MEETRLRHHILLAMMGLPNVIVGVYVLAGALVSATRPLPMDSVGEILGALILAMIPMALILPHLVLTRLGAPFAYGLAAGPWMVFCAALVLIGQLNQAACSAGSAPAGAGWGWCTRPPGAPPP